MTESSRRELVWLAAALAAGGLVLPPVVYVTGTKTLGAYAGGGLGGFLADFYSSLFRLEPAALLLATGPLLVAVVWRLSSRLASAVGAPADRTPGDD